MKRKQALAGLAAAALVASPAAAQDAAPYDLRAAFTETDRNADGAIEIDEFHDRLVDVFFLGDADKDGFLVEEEFVKVVVVKEDFAAIDKNGDAKLTRREFVGARLPRFIAIDADEDGSLSFAELEAALAGTAK